MGWIIFGAILLGAGFVLFFVQKGQSQRLGNIQGTLTSKAGDLQRIAQAVATEVGSGAWREYAELKGQVLCPQPLISELTKTPCAYYEMKVIREYEETYTDRDNDGNREERTRRGSETISQNTQSAIFYLQDATGKVRLETRGAAIDTVKVLDEFRPEQGQRLLSFGTFSLNLMDITLGNNRSTLGYRFVEQILPLDRDLYVLGQIREENGALVLGQPSEKKKDFIIALRSEEELLASAKNNADYAFYGAMTACALGAALIFFGVLGH